MITRAARGRTDRAESASEDSFAMPATSRWATSNADTRWLAPIWTALPSSSSPPPNLQPGKAMRRDCRHPAQSGGIGGAIWTGNDRRLRELLARLEAPGADALPADPR